MNIDNAIFQIEKADEELQQLLKHIPANRPIIIEAIRGHLYKAKEHLSTIAQQPLCGSADAPPKVCPNCGRDEYMYYHITGKWYCENCMIKGIGQTFA
jgi:hypothetical protein